MTTPTPAPRGQSGPISPVIRSNISAIRRVKGCYLTCDKAEVRREALTRRHLTPSEIGASLALEGFASPELCGEAIPGTNVWRIRRAMKALMSNRKVGRVGKPTLLDHFSEAELVKWIDQEHKQGRSPDVEAISKQATLLRDKSLRELSESIPVEGVPVVWVRNFLTRNPQYDVGLPKEMESERVVAASKIEE